MMYNRKIKGRSRPISNKPSTKFEDDGYKAAEAVRSKVYETIRRIPYTEPEGVDKKTLNYSRACRGNNGLGIGLPSSGEEDYGIGIVVYCVTEDDYYRINMVIGDTVDDVPVYYNVIGIIEPA